MSDLVQKNLEVTRNYLAAVDAMDGETLVALHHPDVIFELLGTTPVSGRFEGRDNCLLGVFPPVMAALVPGTFSFAREFAVAVVDENGAVAVTKSDGDLVAGGRYDQAYFFALTIRDGLVVKVEGAYDTAHVQEVIFGDALQEARPRREFRLPPELPHRTGSAAAETVGLYYAAHAAGDMAAWAALHDSGVVFDITGTLPISGHYEGLQVCIDAVVAPFLDAFDADSYPLVLSHRILCADDRRVAAVVRAEGVTVTGAKADIIAVQLFTVENGRITHIHHQLDTAHIEDVCFANPLRDNRATQSGGLHV